ncbi:MAG: hypothetical protein ACMXYF_04180 [Candidatus Woesearchaeota archaeon]
MIEQQIFPIIIALSYALFLYFLTHLMPHAKKHRQLIINMTGGLMFAYIFLTLIPEIIIHSGELARVAAFSMFVGYIGFYLAEKRTFAALGKQISIKQKVIFIRSAGIHLIHFITGFILVYTYDQTNLFQTFILLVPLTLHIIATTLLYEDLTKWSKETIDEKFVLPFLIFIGSVLAIALTHLFNFPLILFYAFFGGTFVYLITTILHPRHDQAPITYFIFGIFMYIVLLLIGNF